MARRRHANPTPDTGNLTPVLEVLLNDSLAVAQDAKQVHWNVRGHGFRGLHKLFDEIHAAATEYADLIAERLAQFGVATAPRPETSKLPRTSVKDVSVDECVVAMAKDLSKYSERLREAVRLAEDARDAATVDILSEVLRGSDKYLWFVEAYLGQPVKNNPSSRVTFGPMERIDPSAAEMSVLLDDEIVGSISAEHKDISSTRTRAYRVESYLVHLDDLNESKEFLVRKHSSPRAALTAAKAWARERLEPKSQSNPVERGDLLARAGKFAGESVFSPDYRGDSSTKLAQRHVVSGIRPLWMNVFTSIASRSRDLSRNDDVRALNRKLMRGGNTTLSDWEVDLIERTIVENMDALQDPLTDKEIERVFKGIDAFREGLPEPPRSNPRASRRNACSESLFNQAVAALEANDLEAFEGYATRWAYDLYGSKEGGEQAIAEAIEHEGNRFDALRVMVFG